MINKGHQISIYGKGGVGKSTITVNLAVNMARRGQKLLVAGCSPKGDSTYFLLGGLCTPTILEALRKKGNSPSVLNECIKPAAIPGIYCTEAGGPEPVSGCAGRGVYLALDLLKKSKISGELDLDLVIYDVIADVVCGGFSQPMKNGFSDEIYIVSTEELMSLYAANNICSAVTAINRQFGTHIRVGGLIYNARRERGESIMHRFCDLIGVPLIAAVPHSPLVQKAELQKQTVLALFPDSDFAGAIDALAARIIDPHPVIPRPIDLKQAVETIAQLLDGEKPPKQVAAGFVRSQATLPGQAAPTAQRRIAIYGKAGIGKSITASNLSAALSDMGEQVMQIGCDPKRDSVALLAHCMVPTILDQIDLWQASGGRSALPADELEKVLIKGYNGILCAESGGPPPGIGCSGLGVKLALEQLGASNLFTRRGITYAIFDILGDVVCGGFAQPLRAGFCKEVYIVTNGEALSLYVTNNILKAVRRLVNEGLDVGIGGLINNCRGVEHEKEIVESYAKKVGVPVIITIPRSSTVQAAEKLGMTVVEAFPDSEQAQVYRDLAKQFQRSPVLFSPVPLDKIEDILNI